MNSVNHNKLLKPIPCVQISHVTKRFGEDLVLKEVNLDLNYGQVYGIVGNNGSGKTVLMKCICGFLPATTGTIHVSGKQIGKDTDFPESLGVIIETPGFLTQYTGMKNLEILANMQRLISKALDKHGVAEIRELLLELKAAGKTILLASHNEEDIRILCDHVYEMDGGILKERTG